MNKNELLDLAARFEVEVDSDMIKEEIKNAISDAGITNDDLEKSAEPEADDNAPAESDDEVVVRMMRNTSYYQYGTYTFTKKDPFAIMKKEDAEQLLERRSTEFKKATQEELRRFFK